MTEPPAATDIGTEEAPTEGNGGGVMPGSVVDGIGNTADRGTNDPRSIAPVVGRAPGNEGVTDGTIAGMAETPSGTRERR